MAPGASATPSKKGKNGVDEEQTISRALKKLETAFNTNLTAYVELLKKCKEGVTKSSINGSPHESVLCDYITSAVRGTYGNKGSGSGGTVFSGLDRKNRCYMLRICMKYLMYHYCVKENDITTILEAMKERVSKWTVGGDGDEKEKRKNRRAFGRCMKKSWKEEKEGEKKLKCSVIKIIEQIKTNTSGRWSQLKSLKPSGGSGTCSTASNTQHINQYGNDCSSQPNGAAAAGGGGAGVAGVVDNVDSEESEDDDEDEDDNDGAVTAAATTTPTQSTSHSSGHGIGSFSPSLPPGNGKGGKGRNGKKRNKMKGGKKREGKERKEKE